MFSRSSHSALLTVQPKGALAALAVMSRTAPAFGMAARSTVFINLSALLSTRLAGESSVDLTVNDGILRLTRTWAICVIIQGNTVQRRSGLRWTACLRLHSGGSFNPLHPNGDSVGSESAATWRLERLATYEDQSGQPDRPSLAAAVTRVRRNDRPSDSSRRAAPVTTRESVPCSATRRG